MTTCSTPAFCAAVFAAVVVALVAGEGRTVRKAGEDVGDRTLGLDDIQKIFQDGDQLGIPAGKYSEKSNEGKRRIFRGKNKVSQPFASGHPKDRSGKGNDMGGDGVFPEEFTMRNDVLNVYGNEVIAEYVMSNRNLGDGVFPEEITVRAINNHDMGDGVFPEEVTVRAINNRDVRDGVFPEEITVRAINNRDVKDGVFPEEITVRNDNIFAI